MGDTLLKSCPILGEILYKDTTKSKQFPGIGIQLYTENLRFHPDFQFKPWLTADLKNSILNVKFDGNQPFLLETPNNIP
jgi:hypothetical protein